MTIIDEMNDLAALAAEPLCEELAEHVYEGDWGLMLKHPLVFSVPLSLPGLANRALVQKTALLAGAIEREDWHSVVFLHERPYRLEALIEYVVGRDDDGVALPLVASSIDARELAATVWVDSENIPQCMEDWTALFRGDDLWLGDAEEREEFDALPDPIPAWRGEIDDGGWSHTTDEKVARFFATRFGANAAITQVLIPKDKVFGYLTRRGESELLVRR